MSAKTDIGMMGAYGAVNGTGSNVNRWEEVYTQLPDTFTRDDVNRLLVAMGVTTPLKNVIYRWRLLGCIATTEVDERNRAVAFKKAK